MSLFALLLPDTFWNFVLIQLLNDMNLYDFTFLNLKPFKDFNVLVSLVTIIPLLQKPSACEDETSADSNN